MFYLYNCMEDLKIKERKIRTEVIFQIVIGGKGNVYEKISITCPENITLNEGINYGFCLGKTKSGKLKIEESEDDKIYLIISSKGGCDYRTDGVVSVLKKYENSIKLISSGDGFNFENGKGGWWNVHLISIDKNLSNVFWIKKSGSDYNNLGEFIIIENGRIYNTDFAGVTELYEKIGKTIPFSTDNFTNIKENSWKQLS